MPKILAVHGVGQQFKGNAIIHKEWWPAIRSGLSLAKADNYKEEDLTCAFYGNLFRKTEGLSISETYNFSEVSSMESELLKLLWEAASLNDPSIVPSPVEFDKADMLVRYPQILQRTLNALSKSSFFTNISTNLMIGDLKQVIIYMNDTYIRETVLKSVTNLLTDDILVVIGHSLGSVVAYEALCRTKTNVVTLITLGSPLGIRNLIFDRLNPTPIQNKGAWPNVKYWTNVSDKGDLVALEKKLAPLFGERVNDLIVFNGSDAHHGERYLDTKEVGEAIRKALCQDEY